MSGGDYDGDTAVVMGNQDIVREQKRDPPPATPHPLRGKFNAVNLHSLVSSGDRDVVLECALKDACLVVLRDASMDAAFHQGHGRNVLHDGVPGTLPVQFLVRSKAR